MPKVRNSTSKKIQKYGIVCLQICLLSVELPVGIRKKTDNTWITDTDGRTDGKIRNLFDVHFRLEMSS